MSAKKLFPAGVVGSLPRPQFIQDIILHDGNPFSPIIDKAVLFAIAFQEQAGLDIISDGEWRRKSYLGPIAKVTDSFTDHFFDNKLWRHIVTRKINHVNPGFFAKEAAFLKKHSSCQIKVCMPSPYLIGQRCWEKEESTKAYKNRHNFMEAIVPVLRKEILLLKDAGVDIIQIDDPHICLFVDKELRQQFKNPESELKYACGLVNEVVKDIKGVKTALHLCRRNKGRDGWIGEGGYEPIIPEISQIDVDQFVLEYSIPVAGDHQALKQLPEKYDIGLGCVGCRFEKIDTAKEIVERVEKALRYVDPARITLNPDCGFAPGSQRYIPLDESYLKLKREVQAAEKLRKKYT